MHTTYMYDQSTSIKRLKFLFYQVFLAEVADLALGTEPSSTINNLPVPQTAHFQFLVQAAAH